MKTFIVLTFAFLGFALYEMSGGADFEPASARAATTEPAPKSSQIAEAPKPVEAAPVMTADATVADIPAVTRVSLNLTSVKDAAPQATVQPVPAPRTQIAAAPSPVQPQITPVSFDQGSVISSEETPQIILPSLIATTEQPRTYSGDIRTVSGNRVNVRGGPSTSFGVVGSLSRGEEVRVLDDNGNGWVLMEAVEGGAEGWMADFLLTSG